jgi:hypothetical protein
MPQRFDFIIVRARFGCAVVGEQIPNQTNKTSLVAERPAVLAAAPLIAAIKLACLFTTTRQIFSTNWPCVVDYLS